MTSDREARRNHMSAAVFASGIAICGRAALLTY
jgi:hypothetical protein